MANKRLLEKVLVAALLPLASCMATVGVSNFGLPPDAAKTCAAHCKTIGMNLTAVAIMAENVGCVCQYPAQPPASPPAAGEFGTPPGGMTAIAAQQAAAAMALAQQQKQRQSH